VSREPDCDDPCFICLKPIHQPATGRPCCDCSDRCRQQKRRAYDYRGWRDPRHWDKVERRAARELKRIEKRTGPIDDMLHPEWGISLRYCVLFRLQRSMPIPECEQCGRLYVVDAPGSFPEFCSPKCHQEYVTNEQAVKQGLIDHAGNYDPRVDVRIRLGLPIRAWEHCGMLFARYVHKQKFCSDACRNAHWFKTHRRCLRCGKSFSIEGKAHRKKYCSSVCANTTRSRRQQGLPARSPERSPRVCQECGSTYIPQQRSVRKQKYCSLKCNSHAKSRRFRERKRGVS
jgi:hypothetical protein